MYLLIASLQSSWLGAAAFLLYGEPADTAGTPLCQQAPRGTKPQRGLPEEGCFQPPPSQPTPKQSPGCSGQPVTAGPGRQLAAAPLLAHPLAGRQQQATQLPITKLETSRGGCPETPGLTLLRQGQLHPLLGIFLHLFSEHAVLASDQPHRRTVTPYAQLQPHASACARCLLPTQRAALNSAQLLAAVPWAAAACLVRALAPRELHQRSL